MDHGRQPGSLSPHFFCSVPEAREPRPYTHLSLLVRSFVYILTYYNKVYHHARYFFYFVP